MKDRIGMYLLQTRINTVLPHIKGKLLDIGCGTNEVVQAYRKLKDGDGTGVDVFDWGNVDLVVEDTAKLPFPDATFDTVTIIAALNHIPNREEVLKESYRLLKPSGKIILTMIPPAISTVWHKLRAPWDIDQSERGMIEGEVYGLSKKQVRSLLQSAVFKIKTEQPFMLGINNLVVAEK